MCLIRDLLIVYTVILFARVLLSWFPRLPGGPIRPIIDLVYLLTEPALRLVRGLLPAIRMGGMALDLSPIILFLVLSILTSVIRC